MAVIVLQPRAKADLSDIWQFIAEDSDDQADAFIDLIDQKFELLAQQSGLGRRREELAEGLRSFPVGPLRHLLSAHPRRRSDRAGAAWCPRHRSGIHKAGRR